MATRNIDDLIDPERPDYLKRGVLLSAAQWLEAAQRSMRNPKTGNSLGLIGTSPNPESLKVIRGEPGFEQQRETVEEAAENLVKAKTLIATDDQTIDSARSALKKFEQEWSAVELTATAWTHHQSLLRAVVKAEATRKNDLDILDEAIRKDLDARLRLDQSAFNELIRRREEEAAQKAAAQKALAVTFSERWAKFTQRVIG